MAELRVPIADTLFKSTSTSMDQQLTELAPQVVDSSEQCPGRKLPLSKHGQWNQAQYTNHITSITLIPKSLTETGKSK